MMNIGFFGTPDIALYCLDYLLKQYDIAFVVTNPDKPKGRSKYPVPSPVKEKAGVLGIPCFQPLTLKDDALIQTLKDFHCDIFVVVAYGKLIPRDVFLLPPLGTINLHPSLLPKYRGAAPVQWALYNGEHEIGITVQLINEQLDAGDIVMQKTIPVDLHDTSADVYEKVIPPGAEMLAESIDCLFKGTIAPKPQDHALATYCGKITTETAHINWEMSSLQIHNMVRAFNPKPVAWTMFREKLIKIWKTDLPDNSSEKMIGQPGTLVHTSKRLFVCTGRGMIEVILMQPETKKPMDAIAFLNGYRLQDGERFI